MQESHGYFMGPFCQTYRRHHTLHNGAPPKQAAAHEGHLRDATSTADPSCLDQPPHIPV